VGVDLKETSREVALCAHTIMSDEPLVVLDTTKDARFADNPVVAQPPHVRFYAGAPLITAEGMRIGTICLIHFVPREIFDEGEKKSLADFAALAMEAIEIRQVLATTGEKYETGIASATLAAKTEAAKRQFLAVVGHELRTPLNAILGFGALLKECDEIAALPAHREYVNAIYSSGQRLLSTVDAVLSYAQAEKGEIELKPEPLDLAELIASCASVCGLEALPKNIRIVVPQKHPGLPTLLADRVHTEQMLLQLLSNAVAFTTMGQDVSVRVETAADGGVIIAVDDTGPGIDQDEVGKALEIFRQLSEGMARQKEGLGIGLPLTKLLVELHGGRLDIESGAEQGTTAMLTFPPYRTLPPSAPSRNA
jgi:signal transduction histidine kinase